MPITSTAAECKAHFSEQSGGPGRNQGKAQYCFPCQGMLISVIQERQQLHPHLGTALDLDSDFTFAKVPFWSPVAAATLYLRREVRC